MRDFGRRPGAGSATGNGAASGYPVPGKSTLTEALGPVPAVQRKALESSSPATVVDGDVAISDAEADKTARPDEG